MIRYTFLLLVLLYSTAHAIKIDYNKMTPIEGYDARFIIEHEDSHNDYSILDCQSFIHKFDSYDKYDQLKKEVFIDINECESLYFKIDDCIQNSGSVCIDTDNLEDNSCNCN